MQCSEKRATMRRRFVGDGGACRHGVIRRAGRGKSQGPAIDLGAGDADRRLGRRAHALKEKNGIDVTLNYIGETFAVLSGGLRGAASYEGRSNFRSTPIWRN